LIAVRVELPEVFAATHQLLLELNAAGLIDGFRIDHPDGLADPAGYLAQLRRASRRGTLVWVEKILEGSEDLPTEWKCAGTTGYDAMRAIQAALVDTAEADVVTRTWREAGGQASIDEAVAAAKRQVVDQSLVPEVARLTRRAREAAPQLDPERLRAAVVELLVAGEVYRAYLRPDDTHLSDDA
ncbi:MAG: malto-oligosyltrehalose synthase, partial [Micrococcales bacterium]|nr:malto-oligosyltrehalose synthase [Micrococcales bacterium]